MALAVEAATRREFIGILAAAGLLASCGTNTTNQSGAASSGAYPRTIQHAGGSTEIPVAPERILALYGQDDLDDLIALGVTPLATAENGSNKNEVPPWVGDSAGFTYVDMRPDPNLEQIASLTPDLILTNDGFFEDIGDKLKAIAPTIAYATADPWQKTLRLFGQVLAKETEAEAKRAQTEEQLRTVSARVKGCMGDRTISVVQAFPDSYWGSGSELIAGGLFTPYGFRFSKTFTGIPELELSAEKLDLLDADVILIQGDAAEIRKQPLFAKLPAVQAGRVLEIKDYELAAAGPNALKVGWTIDNLIPKILTTAGGC